MLFHLFVIEQLLTKPNQEVSTFYKRWPIAICKLPKILYVAGFFGCILSIVIMSDYDNFGLYHKPLTRSHLSLSVRFISFLVNGN